MLRIIRWGITLMVAVVILGGGFVLYSRHSLTAELDATIGRISDRYASATVSHVLPLLQHNELTGKQLSMLHALSATSEYFTQASSREERVRTIMSYQQDAHSLIRSISPAQVALILDEHLVSFAREMSERGDVRREIDRYNDLLVRIRGVEDNKQASLLSIENPHNALPFLSFDGPAPAHAEVTM